MVNKSSAHEALGPLLCCNPVRKSKHRQMWSAGPILDKKKLKSKGFAGIGYTYLSFIIFLD